VSGVVIPPIPILVVQPSLPLSQWQVTLVPDTEQRSTSLPPYGGLKVTSSRSPWILNVPVAGGPIEVRAGNSGFWVNENRFPLLRRHVKVPALLSACCSHNCCLVIAKPIIAR
jgi:hypothetical protein